MKIRFASFGFVTLCALCGCGASQPAPAASPAAAPAPDAPPAAPTATAETTAAPAPAPVPAASPAPVPVPVPSVEASVVEVKNEIATPKVVSPDQVIAGVRPKLNACYQDGLKKDPKLEGSVTLSAKIEKDGKVSAVTPKMLEGLNPAVLKCLGDAVKGANFAPSGGMNYATSIDIPVRFATN